MKKKLLLEGQNQDERVLSFIRELVARFQPLYIIKFSESVKSKFASGSFMEKIDVSSFHYHLLMVVEGTTRIEHGVQDFVNTHFYHGKITILVHSRETMEEAISANSRFFIHAFNTGILLYNHEGILNLFPQYILDEKQSLQKARVHFNHRIPMAKGFLVGAAECYSNRKYNVSVFMLHQTVEQCCIALIRIFMSYRADIHHLGKLLDLCCCFSEQPKEIFLNNEENSRLFKVLMDSYLHARYRDNFNVDIDDADDLYRLVKTFFDLSKKLCEERINELSLACGADELMIGG